MYSKKLVLCSILNWFREQDSCPHGTRSPSKILRPMIDTEKSHSKKIFHFLSLAKKAWIWLNQIISCAQCHFDFHTIWQKTNNHLFHQHHHHHQKRHHRRHQQQQHHHHDLCNIVYTHHHNKSMLNWKIVKLYCRVLKVKANKEI